MSTIPAKNQANKKFVSNVLKKIKSGRLSKTEGARRLGVSRKTVYQWLNSDIFDDEVKSSKKLESFIIKVAVAKPEYGPERIFKVLKQNHIQTSTTRIWQVLKKHNISTRHHREVFSLSYRPVSQARNEKFPAILRLSANARKRMVEDVVLGQKSIAKTAREYGISRKTIYKWKERYQLASSESENLLAAMSDNHPTGSDHQRGVSKETVKAILDLIISNPALSSHKISGQLGFVGNHGVQRVMERGGLNRYEMRKVYATNRSIEPEQTVSPVGVFGHVKSIFEGLTPSMLPAPPPTRKQLLKNFFQASFLTFLISLGLVNLFSTVTSVGLFFASLALLTGSFFFLYSLKYYITLAIVLSYSQQETNGQRLKTKGSFLDWILGSTKTDKPKSLGLESNLDNIVLKQKPFVSVHVALFNEKNVVERLSKALTSFDYPEYEVILADDSTDETVDRIRKFQKKYLFKGEKLKVVKGDGWSLTSVEVKPGVTLKHLHRTARDGFKGAALGLALKLTNKRAQYVSVFDADFVPYPDTLTQFLKYFQESKKVSNEGKVPNVSNAFGTLDTSKSFDTSAAIAAVQGYQWHVLNKSENWITRGVRSEYAGSYVIERAGAEIYGGLKQISGSVYMIKKNILESIGWGRSITEDFQLTLKLYNAGYKVAYTPYVQAPAECVSTLKRLIRQRMRWAEGHSQNIKKMFKPLMSNPKLTKMEKFEFLYLSPYYLQALFFLVGTFSWLISETIFKVRLPFWTELWGWSLVLTNMISLPLVNAVGLFLEESEEKDYSGLGSFIALSYILVPFQAYAAVKGFLESEEGGWFRTPKTGRVTDIFTRGRFMRFVQGILPGRVPSAQYLVPSQYLALETSNNRFDTSPIRKKIKPIKLLKRYVLTKSVLAVFLAITITLNYLAVFTINTSSPASQQGKSSKISQGNPNDPNALKENPEALEIEKSKGTVAAAEGFDEVYRWQVETPAYTYSFGLQEQKGIKPVVKMRTTDGWWVRYTPNFASKKFVEPKVDGNIISWELSKGITARYTISEGKVKADYIVDKEKYLPKDGLTFDVSYNNQDYDDSRDIKNKGLGLMVSMPQEDGSLNWINEKGATVFEMPYPIAIDNDNQELKGKITRDEAGLKLEFDPSWLQNATYPLTIDPTTITDSGTALSTAYGSQRHVVRDSNGNIIVLIGYFTWIASTYSNDKGVSWSGMSAKTSGYDGGPVSIGIDESGATKYLYFSYQDTDASGTYVANTIQVGRCTISYSGSSISSIGSCTQVQIDSSGWGYRPSLIVTGMGSNDHVAVAWPFGGKSGGTNRAGMRFMHCKLSNDCTSIDNWCGANANTGATECGTAASSITADGDADVTFVETTRNTAAHGVLNQLAPTGSGTYAKDLVIVSGNDVTNDIGTAYTAWDSGNSYWGSWSADTDNITATAYDDADGYNMTLSQDNLNDELVLSYHNTTSSVLEALRLGDGDQPDAASPWEDITSLSGSSFPTGDNLHPSVGVDSSTGHYYLSYKDATNNYLRFTEVDGTNHGTDLGNNTGTVDGSTVADVIWATKATLSTAKSFSFIRMYSSNASASCNVRAGIYSDDSGSPGVLLAQAQETTWSAAGYKVHLFDKLITLTSGDYWMAAVGDAGTCELGGQTSGGSSYYSSHSFSSGDNLPFNFPAGSTSSKLKNIYARVDWGPEVVLDQAYSDFSYPSVAEAVDTTNDKVDLIYTGNTDDVFYHTWHQNETFSYGTAASAPTTYADRVVFMDEEEYDDLTVDDTNYVDQATSSTIPVYILKIKNPDRATNPQVEPTFIGRSTSAPTSNTVYLKIWDRNSGSWADCDTESGVGASTDFTLTCNKSTNLDYYYFADDWVYFMVYQGSTGTYTFSADYFDFTPFTVPENTLALLLLVPFMPKLVEGWRKKRYALEVRT